MIAMKMPNFTFSSKLRRVRKEDVDRVHKPSADPLELCLATWTAWMQRADRDLGIKGMTLISAERDSYESESDSDSVYVKRDNEIAGAVDASISSLCTSHRWAIFRKQGVATAWRFPNLDYMAETLDATQQLENKLRVNLATRSLFV